MKNKVSELMDGELNNQDAKKTIQTLNRKNELQNDWDTYHLIGDILRQSSTTLSTNFTQRVRLQLDSEPTVFSPIKSASGSNKTKVFAFATAASVVAMVSAWLVMHNVYQESQPIMVVDHSKIQTETDQPMTPVLVSHPSRAVSYSHIPVENMNNYLFFHNEFAPGRAVHEQSVYIYPVTDFHDNHKKYGK
ncbi:sigma-E factor negative regulatory protein [Nitrosomonas aestuarii]|uniref:sigma-E factor negative regulatory protein n=1 Tax=Nitrosomonas aestuarii TaxID=52441 RepID=UPI000D3009BE|nr:sigma-E factor negative regulatory protein [Nitrosomonas aestuarii]PTN12642.1 sigma-E factor negative regulatory protein RseA [Nitrosomonas aestuarii]